MNNEITVEEAENKIKEGEVCVLDVRTSGERAKGYIEGSEHLDFRGGNFKSDIEKLDRSKTYIVYCASGIRSGTTVKLMQELGFSSCFSIIGGFNEWVKKEMKVMK